MRRSKMLLVFVLIFTLGLLGLQRPTMAYSLPAGPVLELGIVQNREDGYAYRVKAGTGAEARLIDVWKIVTYVNGGKNFNNAIYCIKAGPGFGGTITNPLEKRTYDVTFDLKKVGNIPSNYKSILPTDTEKTTTIKIGEEDREVTYTNYNALLWIIDNMYLPKDTNAIDMKNKLLTAAFKEQLEEEITPKFELSQIHLTDSDIELVQQLAIWHFTNSGDNEYDVGERLPEIQISGKDTTSSYSALGDIKLDNDEPARRDEDAQTLYTYLINNAMLNANSYGNGDDRNLAVPVELLNTSLTSEYTDDEIIVGPFKIEKKSELAFDIEGTVLNQNDEEITDYKLYKENAEGQKVAAEEGASFNSLVGDNFYIGVKKDLKATELSLKIKTNYYESTANFWTVSGSSNVEQPVVMVEKTLKSPEQKVGLNYNFDLALKKFITKVNSMDITDRVISPVIETDKSFKGQYSPAKPAALAVESGDIVVYTIRIFNEGKVAGYAQEVKDDIPEGLEFLPDHEINTQYNWKKTEDGKSIVTDYLKKDDNATNLIKVYDSKEMSTLDYKDVKVAFKVIAPNSHPDIITNTAEIAEDADENGNPIEDIDSIPNNGIKSEDDIDTEVIKLKEFDLALRKFITAVNSTEITSRIPTPEVSATGKIIYKHDKTPVSVHQDDIVVYTIRVYNEGQTSGYANIITDDIPEGTEFIIDNAINTQYRWKLSEDAKTVSTDYLSRERDEDNILAAFTGRTTPDYKDIKIALKVTESNNSSKILINTAEITDDKDKNGNDVKDKDSEPGNFNDEGKDENHNFKEDDIDKEYIKVECFDLALRKFITKVNDTEITTRVPKITFNTTGRIIYKHPKDDQPVMVATGDLVTYTLRLYNEGTVDGYAKTVYDDIPEGLAFVTDNAVNKQYGWTLSKDGKSLTTDYLSREKAVDNLIKAFDRETMQEPAYKDLKIVFKVTEPNNSTRMLVNTAEIADDSDKDGNAIVDIDSEPNNKNEEGKDANHNFKEDDIDKEYIKLKEFDLALRKFITKVNDTDVTTREPQITFDETGKIIYKHPKDEAPVMVSNNYIVTYTMRVYNEGKIDGYAEIVRDDIPDGLEFLPDNETNKQYAWKKSEDGKSISTDYLSKAKAVDNLIVAFDKDKMGTPAYKEVKVAFKVTGENLPEDRVLVNTAEIAEDADKNGNPVNDKDSIPGNGNEEGKDENHNFKEDDIDKEYIKVQYFDLSLLKWVNKVILTVDGQTTERETGHTGLENPEPVVKQEIDKKKINSTTVKFEYTIKITNEGQIAGFAKEISDYIPDGLEFIQADNPNWTMADGKVTTRALEGTLLQPGESAEVKIILNWIRNSDNMGVKTNVAEISEDYNDYHVPDIDSTPNNKVEGEDDIDNAPVALSIKTGGATVIYFGLIGIVLVTVIGGVTLIRKYVM